MDTFHFQFAHCKPTRRDNTFISIYIYISNYFMYSKRPNLQSFVLRRLPWHGLKNLHVSLAWKWMKPKSDLTALPMHVLTLADSGPERHIHVNTLSWTQCFRPQTCAMVLFVAPSKIIIISFLLATYQRISFGAHESYTVNKHLW